MKRTLILILISLLTGYTNHAQLVKPNEAKKWKKELHNMKQQLSERHVNLYHSISKDSFNKAIKELDDRIPSLSTNQILVEFAKIVAMVGDGHTSFLPGNQKKKWFRFYPIKFWSFSDGIYIIATSKEYTNLLGKRLTQIDDTSIEDAFTEISTTIGADNDMEFKYSVPFELSRPEMLHALGIAKSPDMAEFIFDGDVAITLNNPLKLKEWRNTEWITANGMYKGEKPPSMRLDFLFATPLTLEHLKQKKYYWFTYLEAEKAIFFQYNVCWDQEDRPTFPEVTNELFQFMDNNPVERLIIDVRQNSGGEPNTAQSLIDGLSKRTKFTEEGRLFVLVGRRTFSAALTNAVHLRSKASARIVGEYSRGKPNSPSEGRDIDLKSTKVWLTVSTQFVERDPTLGDADYLPVDIKVAHTFKSFQAAQDLDLQAALNTELLKPKILNMEMKN